MREVQDHLTEDLEREKRKAPAIPDAGAIQGKPQTNFPEGRPKAIEEKKTAAAPGLFETLAIFIGSVWSLIGDSPFWLREFIRKSLHIGVVVLALPLRWLSWRYGLLFSGVALIWNAYGMPRFFRFTFREEEEKAGYSLGMLSYPVSVFALMFIFPLPIAVSQWATLSFGDGFATLVGRFYGSHKLPWNKEKTAEGFLGFLVMGSLASMFFFWFTLPNAAGSSFLWEGAWVLGHMTGLSLYQIAVVCLISTAAAGFFETLPIPYIDDNVAAPLAGATAKLLLCYLV